MPHGCRNQRGRPGPDLHLNALPEPHGATADWQSHIPSTYLRNAYGSSCMRTALYHRRDDELAVDEVDLISLQCRRSANYKMEFPMAQDAAKPPDFAMRFRFECKALVGGCGRLSSILSHWKLHL